MNRTSKDDMLRSLNEANIHVPSTASIAQIRTLYNSSFGYNLTEGEVISDELPVTKIACATTETVVASFAEISTIVTSNHAAASATYATTAVTTYLTPSVTYATNYSSEISSANESAAAAGFCAVVGSIVTPIASVYSAPSVTSALTADFIPSVASAPYVISAVNCSSVVPSVFTPRHSATRDAMADVQHQDETDLDAELNYLRKQQEILTLRREINHNQQVSNSIRIDVSSIETMVPKFTGDEKYDVRKWVNDLEDAFVVLNFDERAKLISCRRLLDGTAKIFLRTIAVSNYAELKNLLLEEFGHDYTLQEVYHQLKTHRRKPNESLLRYVLEMQEIASRAPVPETELIDFIIQGIGDNSTAVSMLYSANNIKQLKLLLTRYERHCFKATSTRVTPPSVPTTYRDDQKSRQFVKPQITNMPNKNSISPTAMSSSTSAAALIRCFNCSKYGHYQSTCPHPLRTPGSCFRCGELTHVYRDCPRRPKQMVATTGDSGVNYAADVIDSLDALQMVSVSFISEVNKCTDSLNLLSLFDSGSPKSFINSKHVPQQYIKELKPSGYHGLGSTKLKTYGNINCVINHMNKKVKHKFLILPYDAMSVPLIIGRDLLLKLNVHLCKLKRNYSIKELKNLRQDNYPMFGKTELISALETFEILKISKRGSDSQGKNLSHNINSVTIEDLTVDIPSNCRLTYFDDDIYLQVCSILEKTFELDINPDLSSADHTLLEAVINSSYFDFPLDQILSKDHFMKINLTHDTPIFCRPRPLSYAERAKVRKIVDDLMKEHVIQPSESPYASAIVLVPKKNGEIRKCVDYRPINKITIRDNHPLPLIDNCLEHLGGKSYFTLIDLKNGFHHVKMHPDSVKYTSFVTPDGQYEYLRMPFGLKNAPAVFQRMINGILRDLIDSEKLVVYLDDIVIGTRSFMDHLEIVGEVLKRLRKYNLEIRVNKCKFAYTKFDYLGYCASVEGITPSTSHLEAIQKYPMPTNKHEVQQCLGLFSFFRRFVPSFSRIASPMTQLLRKNTSFNFDEKCVYAFCTLRDLLISAPILSIYNPASETELHCDASSKGFGSALMQRQKDNKFHPVAFFSKTTSASESKLHSYELETLAVVYALQRFHTYLQGIPFKIVTDCNSLAQTLAHKNSSAKIARWALKFENYNYSIQHRPGKSMGHVDALSRTEIAAVSSVLENIAIVEESDLDFQLQLTQGRDKEITSLRSQLENGDVEGFILKDGLVFRQSPSGVLQLYVPGEMVDNVIRQIHEKIGHLASGKCCDQLKKNYWFPQMKNRVDNFIKNCIKCIMFSPSASNRKHNLYNIPKHPCPFDTIHIDHLGPLPAINSRKKYLLVVIDAFTKFVKLYPVSSTSTQEVCVALKDYFDHYSRPRRLISDRGTCFTSNEFNKFLEENNVIHIKVATASPQANGQVERVNRVLRPMLSKLSDPIDHGDWFKQVPLVEYALNNTIQVSTQQTPSVLLFGVEQRGQPIDEFTEYLNGKILNNERNLESLRQDASEHIVRSQQKNLDYFMKHSVPAENFSVGDYVVIKNVDTTAGSNKKLIPRYKGPYVVSKALPNDRYVVRDIDGCQITQIPYNGILESNKLRKWKLPLVNPSPDAEADLLIHLEIEPLVS